MAVNISPHSPPLSSVHFTSRAKSLSFSLSCASLIVSDVGSVLSISGPESPLFYLPGTYRDPSSSCTTRKSYRRYYTYDCCQTFSLSLAREKTCVPTIETIQSSGNQQVYSVGGWSRISHFSNQKPEGLSLNWSQIASHLIADVYQTR